MNTYVHTSRGSSSAVSLVGCTRGVGVNNTPSQAQPRHRAHPDDWYSHPRELELAISGLRAGVNTYLHTSHGSSSVVSLVGCIRGLRAHHAPSQAQPRHRVHPGGWDRRPRDHTSRPREVKLTEWRLIAAMSTCVHTSARASREAATNRGLTAFYMLTTHYPWLALPLSSCHGPHKPA